MKISGKAVALGAVLFRDKDALERRGGIGEDERQPEMARLAAR